MRWTGCARSPPGAASRSSTSMHPDIVVVLGGDGTMLRALQRWLGTGIPCLGVNFGRVGFLTSIAGTDSRPGLERAFAGGYEVLDLPTLVGDAGGGAMTGVNDIVLTSATAGRMAIVEWGVDGQSLGELGCDGVIAASPTGSTAYNLSAGGPVLVPGTDGYVVTFVSPHSLHARSMVLGRPHTVSFQNQRRRRAGAGHRGRPRVAAVEPGRAGSRCAWATRRRRWRGWPGRRSSPAIWRRSRTDAGQAPHPQPGADRARRARALLRG